MRRLRDALDRGWRLFLPHARITVRIVTAVVTAMTCVLLVAGAFVYWRVSVALDYQLTRDLDAYTSACAAAVAAGSPLPTAGPGEVAQTYRRDGTPLSGSRSRLLPASTVRRATTTPRQTDIGAFIPPPEQKPYRVRYLVVPSPQGDVVLAAGLVRNKRDEALRELLLQLAIADLATIAAAAAVGWGATRAALGPVERYRRAAADASGGPSTRLPVDTDRDDELTRLGTTLNALLAEIEEGQQRERQFLADASHELRSPLALLMAEVDWARHRPRTPEELNEVLGSVSSQTRRLAELADSLLALEEASESSGRRQPVLLADLVAAALAPYDDAAVAVRTDDASISVEQRWVETALGNLVGNALKHGMGTVTVTALVVGDTVELTVTDEGEGIPAELGTAAFERFTRADPARSTPGHGLGLAIVAAVAHRHDGTVSLVPGGVRLTLPR